MLARNRASLNECLDPNKEDVVNEMVSNIRETMSIRNIQLDNQTRIVYEGVLSRFLLEHKRTAVCPLEPGGGKSTLMEAYLKYMLAHDLSNAGAIIVVERIETAKKLANSLGTYTTYMADRPWVDAEFWQPNASSYVMESAFTYKKCRKKMSSYEYGICRGCSIKMSCPIAQKFTVQKKHPIVIMTHTRLKMEAQKLDKYSKWKNVDDKEYQRNLIIIDEKPPLVEISSLKLKDLDQFLTDVNYRLLYIFKKWKQS